MIRARKVLLGTLSGLLFLFIPQIVFSASPEQAFSLKFGGGRFVPYDGRSGILVMGGLSFSASPRLSVDGELEYRESHTEFLGVPDVRVQSIGIRGLVKILFIPRGISPYAGGGFTTSVNIVDTKKIERERPGVEVFDEVGIGSGLFGLAGVLFPAGEDISFFIEGRVGFDIQLTHLEEYGVENLGGFSGIAGMVFHFI